MVSTNESKLPSEEDGKTIQPHEHELNSERITQRGLREAQAVKLVISKRGLFAVFACILLTTFCAALQIQTMYSTLPYVYSSFSAHSLIPTTSIVSSVVAAVFRLPLSRILDLWGRAEGFAVVIFIYTIGLVMMSACQGVVTYAAASVFVYTGYDGMFYILYVIIADNFSLKNRGFMFGLYNLPYLVTTWVGAPVAEEFLAGPGWRWSYGTFAIALPITAVPLVVLLLWNYRSARKNGEIPPTDGQRNTWESIQHYAVEFDFIGLLLIASAFSLFLLPFSLWTNQAKGWRSPMIICMMVFSGVAFASFAVWEKYLAPKTFFPWKLMRDRTIIGGSVASANTYLMYYIWYSYFTSYLQVVQGLSITHAGYVLNIHSVGWVVAGVVAGAFIKTTRRYKWIALYMGTPLQILATGLMFHFSKQQSSIGLIIMAQIFLAIADGLIYLSSEVAVSAVIEKEHIAVVLAIYNMVADIFKAVGSTISAAVWTKVFPEYLARNLPEDAQAQLADIYGSLVVQLSFARGSAEQDGISKSYSQAMEKLFMTSLCLSVIGVVATVCWRNVRVDK